MSNSTKLYTEITAFGGVLKHYPRVQIVLEKAVEVFNCIGPSSKRGAEHTLADALVVELVQKGFECNTVCPARILYDTDWQSRVTGCLSYFTIKNELIVECKLTTRNSRVTTKSLVESYGSRMERYLINEGISCGIVIVFPKGAVVKHLQVILTVKSSLLQEIFPAGGSKHINIWTTFAIGLSISVDYSKIKSAVTTFERRPLVVDPYKHDPAIPLHPDRGRLKYMVDCNAVVPVSPLITNQYWEETFFPCTRNPQFLQAFQLSLKQIGRAHV